MPTRQEILIILQAERTRLEQRAHLTMIERAFQRLLA